MKMTNKRRPGIKWKLFGFFALFVATVIAVLWVFQILLLDDFHEAIKQRELVRTADAFSEAIAEGKSESELDELLAYYAVHRNLCADIYRVDGHRARLVSQADVITGCVLHNINDRELGRLYEAALQAGGSYLEAVSFAEFNRKPGAQPGDGIAGTIYVRLAHAKNGTPYILMLNASMAPVSATVDTLRIQLIALSGVLLVFALILAFAISRAITRPITRIGQAAKRFASGDYETNFIGGGYREVDDLADTLNYASAEVAKSDRLQKELIANISHDLRTPLTMIRGYAEVMRDIPEENTPENVQVIIDEAAHLAELVGDLLDLSRIETGTRVPQPERLNLTQTVHDVMGRYTKLTEKDGYTVTFAAEREVYVSADRTMLLQVIYNLINNAINYTGTDRTVRVIQETQAGYVRIAVSDSGAGIAADQLPLIWDRYYKVDRIHRRAMIGTGLGLSIVKHILDAHGAAYGVDSTPGVGSTFWFALPESTPPDAEL
ncbi:MAG: HAMP domain-containing histidine kinase [Clostridia bacterium]|nr:HAMP domain-containing histidine kinase [Clostridia bacterium]